MEAIADLVEQLEELLTVKAAARRSIRQRLVLGIRRRGAEIRPRPAAIGARALCAIAFW